VNENFVLRDSTHFASTKLVGPELRCRCNDCSLVKHSWFDHFLSSSIPYNDDDIQPPSGVSNMSVDCGVVANESCAPGAVRSQRRRSIEFHTQFAVGMALVTLVGLATLSLYFNVSFGGEASTVPSWFMPTNSHRSLQENDLDNDAVTDYSKYSCNYIFEKTPVSGSAEQCLFAKTCNQGEGVWAPFVFCSTRISRTVYCLLLSPIILLWLVLLFRLLGSTAEDYFSPALEMFSTKLGLPPRFAGVTLLALGNGAADVSATVASILNDPIDGYKMSLGALTGAAMMISGVISAAVILAAQGVPCRGALVRDVAALVITVATVWTELATGSIGPASVTLFLSLYAIFVVLVLVADIYHRAVVLPRLAARAGEAELQRQFNAAQEIPSSSSGPNAIGAILTALSNYDAPQDDLGAGTGGGWAVESELLAADRPIPLHGHGGVLTRSHHPTIPHSPAPASVEQDPDNSYTILQDSMIDRACVPMSTTSSSIPADSWKEAIDDGTEELKQHSNSIWENIVSDDDLNIVSKFLLLCELPFTAMRQVTVPIPCEGYYCRALVALSLALSPWWLVFYLWSKHDFNLFAGGWVHSLSFLIVELCVCAFALCILRFAPDRNGEIALIYSTPIALYGFVIAATWIDTIADSLVSLLNFVGIILRIPGPVIGLTILAWGNSMGDLSANMTMARKGLANMAMTACFAGPVFNILVGLGLGFSSLAAKSGEAQIEVSLSPSVVTGFIFIALNGITLLVIGLGIGKGRIPKQFGYLSLSVYAIYLIVSIALQYSSKYGGR
jgi:solute carrier family 24 (sodium/potassium/calcium exchanger), member 6